MCAIAHRKAKEIVSLAKSFLYFKTPHSLDGHLDLTCGLRLLSALSRLWAHLVHFQEIAPLRTDRSWCRKGSAHRLQATGRWVSSVGCDTPTFKLSDSLGISESQRSSSAASSLP